MTIVTMPTGWAVVRPEAKTIDELCQQLFSFDHGWYRGEPRWFPKRQASIGRFLSETAPTPLDAECNEIARFQHLANAHLTEAERDYVKDDALGWIALMQHHGGPTRLLDWTMSPWVAAYAAARDDRDQSGFIWGFNPGQTNKPQEWDEMGRKLDGAKTIDEYGDALAATNTEMILCFLTVDSTPRMVAQQGMFTFGHPAGVDHTEIIGRYAEPQSARLLVVPNLLKRPLMDRLQAMNVTAATLFPGLDGAGRAIYDTMHCGTRSRQLIKPMNK